MKFFISHYLNFFPHPHRQLLSLSNLVRVQLRAAALPYGTVIFQMNSRNKVKYGRLGRNGSGSKCANCFFVLLNSTNKSKKFKDIMDNNAHL